MRKLLAPFGFLTGAYARRWRSGAYRSCGLALVYHRIAPASGHGDAPGFGVERGLPVDVFEAQMRFLLAHFRPVRTLALLAEDPDASSARFSVTFDDGYHDNLALAAPVLERLGIPATLFVTSDFIGTQRLFWWEQLGELLRATHEKLLELGAVAPELRARWPLPERLGLETETSRERAHWLISMALMRTPPADIEGVLARLSHALRAPQRAEGRSAPLLAWDDVRRWRRAGFDVGAHGASHANLGLANESLAQTEIERCLRAIERETGAAASLFAYPYGGPEHRSPGAVRALTASGCRGAFTTETGLVGPRSDRFALPRFGLSSASRLKCAYHTEQAFASRLTREGLAESQAA
jgi:peptidoglycan/xylan/chitin deacetylase (PgdA/CDA1 family)